MSDAVCVVVCVCVSFALEVGVCFVLRSLHESFLLYLQILFMYYILCLLNVCIILSVNLVPNNTFKFGSKNKRATVLVLSKLKQ